MTGSIFVGQRLHSKEEILAVKDKYAVEQHVPYVIFNSTLAKTYNAGVVPEKQMPEAMFWKDLVVACKHYGKPRKSAHKPGTQKRCNQSTFKRFCAAKFNLSYNLAEKCFIVTKLEENHSNHQIDPLLSANYPEFRRVSQEVEEKVADLFQNEAKTHRIRDVVLNSGVMATAQDIQNLRNRWLGTFKGKKQTPEDALFQQLKLLKEEEPTSVVVVQYDEDTKTVAFIMFQTAYMRECLEKYPEVLIMDSTYKLCDNEMPLVVFMVIDSFGHGKVAGYALVMAEKKEIISAAIESLKIGCPNIDEKVKVIYIDKALTEIACIKDILPHTEIHLCDYHVKDIFKRNYVKKIMVNCEKTGPLLKKLIHAHSKEIYDQVYSELVATEGGPESEFMKYFNKNWHYSELIWSDYQRNRSCTLGERSTGKLESHNGKIKIMVDKKMPVPEVFMRLRVMNRNAAIEHEHRVFNLLSKTKYHKYSNDPVIQQIMKVNTPFVGDLLKRQYERSLEPPSDSTHDVTTERCDCKTFTQYKLVCSHIFRQRRLEGLEIYNHKMVPDRWTVILPSPSAQNTFKEFEIMTAPIKVAKIKKAMTQEERYLLAESVCKRICSLIANYAGDEFHCRICALQNMEDLLRKGKRVAVVGIDAEGQVLEANSVQGSLHSAKLDSKVSLEEAVESSGKMEDPSILVQESQQPNKFMPLTPTMEQEIKLPVKCPVPGRPKGSRLKEMPSKQKNPDSDHYTDSERVEDEDDVVAVNECSHCKGPVTCLTSFTVRNNGRKYIVCASKKTDQCRTFHVWVDMTDQSQREINDDSASNKLEGSLESYGVEEQYSVPEPSTSVPVPPNEVLSPPVSSSGQPSPSISCPPVSTPQGEQLDAAINPSLPERYCFSCKAPATIYTAKTAANYGRRFYSCSLKMNPKCKWINWIDKKAAPLEPPPLKKRKTLHDYLTKTNETAINQGIWFDNADDDHMDDELLKALDALENSHDTSFTENEVPFWCEDSNGKAGDENNIISDERKNRGLLIPDKLVYPYPEGTRWQVTSCNNPNQHYEVNHVPAINCSCSNSSLQICHHSLTCSCPDHMFRKLTCKHMFKIKQFTSCKVSDNSVGLPADATGTEGKLTWENPGDFPIIQPKDKFHIMNFKFSASDFNFNGPLYINDQVIDAFIALVSQKDRLAEPEAALLRLGCLTLENISMGVSSYLNRAKEEHMLFNDVWIVPSHTNRNHWILFIVLIKRKVILVLDPLHMSVDACTTEHLQILRFLIQETHMYTFGKLPNWDEWSIYAPQDVCTQNNGCDCGIYVCAWAYSICTQTSVPENISDMSSQFRAWIANVLFCEAIPCEPLPANNDEDPSNDVEIISITYKEFDRSVANTLQRPWLQMTKPVISARPPEAESTLQFLSKLLGNLWAATDKKCGAPLGCRARGKNIMVLCEGCRDWYHPLCVGDTGRLPTKDEIYLCPLHRVGKTKTRKTQKPLRHQLSIN